MGRKKKVAEPQGEISAVLSTTTEPANVEMPELLTHSEAEKLLRVSRTTFYRMIRNGDITGYSVGSSSRVVFKREELMALLKPMPPTSERQTEE